MIGLFWGKPVCSGRDSARPCRSQDFFLGRIGISPCNSAPGAGNTLVIIRWRCNSAHCKPVMLAEHLLGEHMHALGAGQPLDSGDSRPLRLEGGRRACRALTDLPRRRSTRCRPAMRGLAVQSWRSGGMLKRSRQHEGGSAALTAARTGFRNCSLIDGVCLRLHFIMPCKFALPGYEGARSTARAMGAAAAEDQRRGRRVLLNSTEDRDCL